jgi:excisionase family DNA binding protein
MTLQELPELLTLKQASALINVHPNTLRNWEREGKVKAVRIGSRRDRRFFKASIWDIYQPAAKNILQ